MVDFMGEARVAFDAVVSCRRALHQCPELSGQEVHTSERVASTLESFGIQVQRGVGTPYLGVTGVLTGGRPGPTVALRADMDALPVTEVKDLPYRSQIPGVMHACGHDAHMAMLLGAAQLLAEHREELAGNVKFIFEPNEEREGGALSMIADGALDGVDAIFGLHVDPEFPTGTIVTKPGAVMASSDWLTIDLCGESTHGGYPHRGVDAIVIAGEFLSAVQSLVSRNLDPTESAVITFGSIHGGTARNVICGQVRLEGILRALDPEVRRYLLDRIQGMLEGITKASGGTFRFHRRDSQTVTQNTPSMASFVKQTAKEVLGETAFLPLPTARLGSEPFARYLERVPGAYYFLGTGNPQKDTQHPWHSAEFDIDEEAMVYGTAIQAALAYRYLQQGSAPR